MWEEREGGQHTSICNALNSGVDERGSSPVRIKIDNVDPVALRGMRIHQNAKMHQSSIGALKGGGSRGTAYRASPSFTLTFPCSRRVAASTSAPLASAPVAVAVPPNPFSSTFRVIAAVAWGDISFAITYLSEN